VNEVDERGRSGRRDPGRQSADWRSYARSPAQAVLQNVPRSYVATLLNYSLEERLQQSLTTTRCQLLSYYDIGPQAARRENIFTFFGPPFGLEETGNTSHMKEERRASEEWDPKRDSITERMEQAETQGTVDDATKYE
jgi:hypothetical protein